MQVLIAGFTGGPGQNHQEDMWAPALRAARMDIEGVWIPPTSSDTDRENAERLATKYGHELQISAEPNTQADFAIVCLTGEERLDFIKFAQGRQLPVLLDKPTLDSTEQLEELNKVAGTVFSPYHFAFHPGFTRALQAVRNGEIGLLRAVATDLVVAHGDGAYPGGELANLGVYLLDLLRKCTGPATTRVQAHGEDDSWSLLGSTNRDVVVSAHVSRTCSDAGGYGTLRAAARIVGTHGTLKVDLLAPALEVRRPDRVQQTPFGENSVAATLTEMANIARGATAPPPFSEQVKLSQAIEEITRSAQNGLQTTIQW